MLHKMLHITLKDCWGSHKGCLGPECGPQNRSWESLVYMNWIESHSRIDEGVTVGSCRKNRLLFADDLVLLACSQQFSACTLSVFCCYAIEPEWKSTLQIPRYYVSLQTQGSVCCKWATIHCSTWWSSST